MYCRTGHKRKDDCNQEGWWHPASCISCVPDVQTRSSSSFSVTLMLGGSWTDSVRTGAIQKINPGIVHHGGLTIMNFNVLNFYIQIVKIEFVEFIKLLPAIINLWYEERWKFKLKLIIIKICFEIAADGYRVCCGGRPPGSKLSEVKTLDIE